MRFATKIKTTCRWKVFRLTISFEFLAGFFNLCLPKTGGWAGGRLDSFFCLLGRLGCYGVPRGSVDSVGIGGF